MRVLRRLEATRGSHVSNRSVLSKRLQQSGILVVAAASYLYNDIATRLEVAELQIKHGPRRKTSGNSWTSTTPLT